MAFSLLASKACESVVIATYYSIYSTFIAKPGIWLDDLFVYPQFRGSGVGEALLSELCILAQNTGCGRIDWIVATDNDRGRSFYRSEEHTSELQSLMRNSYAVFCLKKKNKY